MSFRETFELDASPETVFGAWLDQEMLRGWLAENVRVDPQKGGAFRFWGRDVIWCTSEEETEGEILEIDRPHGLVFGWRWKGHATRVSVRVEGAGGKSRLTIEHDFETFAAGSDGPGPDMARCHWQIAIGNLATLIATGRAALRPDYLAPMADGKRRVELEIEIAAPVERVFRALLDPDEVKVWMDAESPEIDVDASRYSYGWSRDDGATPVGPGRILELIPNRLLVHDWKWIDEPEGQVRWELTPTDFGTRLRLVHIESLDVTHSLGWSDALFAIRQLVLTR